MENKNEYAKLATDIFLKNKMPPRSQTNSLELDTILNKLLDQDGKELHPIS